MSAVVSGPAANGVAVEPEGRQHLHEFGDAMVKRGGGIIEVRRCRSQCRQVITALAKLAPTAAIVKNGVA